MYNSLNIGDAVAVKAVSLGVLYGFGAIIRGSGFNHDTTNITAWHAIKATGLNPNDLSWTAKSYPPSCTWPVATFGTDRPYVGESNLLSDQNVKYIWAQNAGTFDTVYFRTIIGQTSPC